MKYKIRGFRIKSLKLNNFSNIWKDLRIKVKNTNSNLQKTKFQMLL